MPSFDIVSEVDRMEVRNAIDQAQRELVSRFDFKGVRATIELDAKTGSILLAVDDGARLKGLREIIVNKLAKRCIDLRNVEHGIRIFAPRPFAAGARHQTRPRGRQAGNHEGHQAMAEGAGDPPGPAVALRETRGNLQKVIGFCGGRIWCRAGFKNFRD
jgi:hypothetical protein